MEVAGPAALQRPVSGDIVTCADTALAVNTFAGIIADIRVICQLRQLVLDLSAGTCIGSILDLILHDLLRVSAGSHPVGRRELKRIGYGLADISTYNIISLIFN